MSLIRNGGFERGNTDFWEVIQGCTLDISNISPLYGTYCGKLTANGSASPIVMSKDYIEVKPYQIVDAIIYMKSATTIQGYVVIYAYDADYSSIDSQMGNWVSNDGTYKTVSGQFIVPQGAAYIRFGLHLHNPTNGDVFYLDGAELDIIDNDSAISGVVELLPMDAYTSSGSTYYNARSMMQFSKYYAELYVDYVSGTSPTLDVEVKGVNIQGYGVSLGTFSTVTAATEERIDLPQCLGNQMYIIYTIGGTDPEFDFCVSVVGKR